MVGDPIEQYDKVDPAVRGGTGGGSAATKAMRGFMSEIDKWVREGEELLGSPEEDKELRHAMLTMRRKLEAWNGPPTTRKEEAVGIVKQVQQLLGGDQPKNKISERFAGLLEKQPKEAPKKGKNKPKPQEERYRFDLCRFRPSAQVGAIQQVIAFHVLRKVWCNRPCLLMRSTCHHCVVVCSSMMTPVMKSKNLLHQSEEVEEGLLPPLGSGMKGIKKP